MEETFKQVCNQDCDEKAKQLIIKGNKPDQVRKFQSQCKNQCKNRSYKF